MFSLFHRPDSAGNTQAGGERARDARSAAANFGQAGAGISLPSEGSGPQEAATGAAGRESLLPVAEERQTLIAEAVSAKSAFADQGLAAQTAVRAEGVQFEGASWPSKTSEGLGGPAQGAEPQSLPPDDAGTTHEPERWGETEPEQDAPPDDDELGLGVPLSPPRGPRRPPKRRQLRLPEEAKRHTFTPQQRLLLLDTRRLTAEKLARRVAQYRRQRAEQKSAEAEDPTPPQSPEPTPAEPKNSAPPLLAPARPSGTMRALGGSHAAPQTTPQAIPSTHREWTFTSWLRRILTPLLPSQHSSEIPR